MLCTKVHHDDKPEKGVLAVSRIGVYPMFSIVKKLIHASDGNAPQTGAARTPPGGGVGSAHSKEAPSSRSRASAPGSLIHRNLCAVILRDTLRMYGIPRAWLSIDVRNLSGQPNMVHLQISFAIRHWHEGLLKYAPVLQKQFLQSLQSFDPDTDYSRQVIFWRFSAKCVCPYTEVPGPAYWEPPVRSDAAVLEEKPVRVAGVPPVNLNQEH